MEACLIEKLKKYFKQRKNIVFAFLYGSEAKRGANKLSDVDIAVYFILRNISP